MAGLSRVFAEPKPILAMLHLKGTDRDDIVARALREVEMLVNGGVDALVVENYFGSIADAEAVLARLAADPPAVPYGVNMLDDGPTSFALAERYGARFVQMDSVAGHLPPAEDVAFAKALADLRAGSDTLLLGGVRFKYQKVLSGNPLDVDLRLAQGRCDAVVVTGDRTGEQTPISKIVQFRKALGPDFPLVVGAGVTAQNCAEQLALSDAAIVGSSLKADGRAEQEVSAAAVEQFMDVVRAVRANGSAS